MGFYNMMSGWGGGWSVAMYLGMVAFWVGVVALVVMAVRGLVGPAHAQTGFYAPRETAMDVLKRRYAAGEIDSVEYQQKKQELA